LGIVAPGAGLRIFNRRFALDLALARPFVGNSAGPLVPWIDLTWNFGPGAR